MQFAYGNAETLLRRQANSWFDLHGELAEERDRRIAAFAAWHGAEALPQYARLAEEAAPRAYRRSAGGLGGRALGGSAPAGAALQ